MKKSSFVIIVTPWRDSYLKNMKLLVGLKAKNKKWEFFGGGLSQNEDPWKAAVREIKEETSIDLSNKKTVALHPIGTRNYKAYVYLTVLDPEQINIKLSKEHLTFAWKNLNEISRISLTRKSTKIMNSLYHNILSSSYAP